MLMKTIHGTIILGIHNEPVKLNVYYYNSKNMYIIYNVQCHTTYNQYIWYKSYQS